MSAKPVAVFRFSDTEGPGHFATFLEANRIPWRLYKLDEGDPVPASSEPFAGLAFMGGPMSANDETPWNRPVLDLMRDAVRRKVPMIGHCLGGQMMSRAFGAHVTKNPVKEIGWNPVKVEDTPAARKWFGDDLSVKREAHYRYDFGRPGLTARFMLANVGGAGHPLLSDQIGTAGDRAPTHEDADDDGDRTERHRNQDLLRVADVERTDRGQYQHAVDGRRDQRDRESDPPTRQHARQRDRNEQQQGRDLRRHAVEHRHEHDRDDRDASETDRPCRDDGVRARRRHGPQYVDRNAVRRTTRAAENVRFTAPKQFGALGES